jgi:N-acetylneuraminic acid mutarotase
MTTPTDSFDHTLSAWLESLEAEEPTRVTAWVVDRARTAPQRPTWLARADLAVGLLPRPAVPATTLRAVALVSALAGAVAIGILAGGARPTAPDVAPSAAPVAPAPSAGLVAPPVVQGAWATVDAPGLLPDGLQALDLYAGLTLVVGDEVRLFDPSQGSWTQIAQPLQGRRSAAAARLPDGGVLVAGGEPTTGETGSPLASTELYSPAEDRWTEANPMATARGSGHTATTLLDGRVLIVGGTEFAGLQSAELYDPATRAWSPTGSMHEARSGHTATLLGDGRVLVTGGSIVHDSAMPSAEIYDPAAGTWTQVAPMSTGRVGHAATLVDDGTVLVSGGHLAISDPGPQAASVRFDPVTGRWSDAGSMHIGRYRHTATLLFDGRVLVVGGLTTEGATAAVELYDPTDDSWIPVTAMTHARQGQAAARLPNGGVLVVGGDQTGRRATAERFLWQAQP